MATPTYDLLDSVTLSSSASSVTFSSIDQSYRDLIIVVSGSGDASNETIFGYLNGDTTTSNYSYVYARGSGSTATSGTSANPYVGQLRTDTVGSNIIQIMDFSATDKHKTILSRWNNDTGFVTMAATRWANTSAVTSIQLSYGASSDYAVGTTFSLFGIAA